MKKGGRNILLPIGDILMLGAAFFAMLELAFGGKISKEVFSTHLLPFVFVFGIWLLVFFLFNLYETESVKPTIPNLRIIGIASLVAIIASTLLFYNVPSFGITPKTNLLIFSAIFLLLFLAWRRIFYRIFSKNFRKTVAFVVDPDQDGLYATELINYIENYPQSGLQLIGSYTSLSNFFAKHPRGQVETLIISKNAIKGEEAMKLIYNSVENVLDLATAYEEMLGKIPVDSIDESWFLYNIRHARKSFYHKISYLVNTLAIFVILIVTLPFLPLIALSIKLEDGGPVFYNQNRVGKKGKIFKLYKFRSMVVDADRGGAEWTEKNDSRITQVGKIIRKLHLDEIPQIFNVLKGDMVLVGPRPEIPSFDEKLKKEIPHYVFRHIIPPGFTGWAQIKYRNARGIAESKKKFEYDLYYVKNQNLFMDLGILLKTIQIIFTHS